MESGNQAQESKKPCSYAEIYDQTVMNYAKQAMNPATLDNARYMVKMLMNESSGLFKNLGQDVKQKIDELKNETRSKN